MDFLKDKFKYKENYDVYGLTKELCSLYIANYNNTFNEDVIVLASSLYEANNIYNSLQTYNDNVLFFPMDEFLTSVAVAISPDLKIKRLETLDKLKKEPKSHIVVTSLMGYLKFLPNPKDEQSITLKPSKQSINRDSLIEKLENLGYHRDSLVTVTGEYAIRGYIMDIFPLDFEKPIRIEFFGDEIESIKTYDENTQRTLERLEEVEIKKFNEDTFDSNSPLIDYLKNKTVFYIDENQIKSSYANLQNEIFNYKLSKGIDTLTKYMFDYEEISPDKQFKINTIDNYDSKQSIKYISREIENFNSDYNALTTFVNKEVGKNTIIFSLESEKQFRIIQDLFKETYKTKIDELIEGKINLVSARFNKGFIFEKYILISPYDIDRTNSSNIKYKNNLKIGRKVKSFTDLQIGDYVVHETHGIGIYKGLRAIKKGEYTKDYIELEYLDTDKVFIPMDNINKLYKYSMGGGVEPKLSKLGTSTWEKKKRDARKRIKDISGELIELYTSRSKIRGAAYKDVEDELKFALAFPYTPTPDQDKTIKEIDIDLKSTIPMDRLLCGDVGYGKTEVAFRAMFKAVMNGYQVSYLCPTTILSKQQYQSALERFKDFPVKIELLNRHISAKKTSEIINNLKNGTVDIVIGTHKLLNEKIQYKNLGLLVIDEEQRFGVTHKEKIKKLKNDINVLTLSATPIPRTLKMAMSGLRGLSVLDTPPINRYPVQTYVMEENDLIIRDAIYKEMTRKGQTFILINNIEELDRYKTKIHNLVPEAKIITGHGRMPAEEINKVMEKFVENEYDILVCTTIIETGIDIPNVNTLIIIDAEKFGLSQLYQIRGRVGRSDKIAYAYLMYNPAKVLTETATKRLESIKEFTELGSGYKIAMRDLAIRGAGDLLGSEQAGFIDAIGLDLYTKIVDEEMRKYKGETIEEEESIPTLNVSNHIDDKYVSDESIKIEIHKMINSIKTKEDIANTVIELEDRFGKIDDSLKLYMLEKCVEQQLKTLNIKNIMQLKGQISITLPEEISDKIDGEKLFMESYSINSKFKFSYQNKKIKISLDTEKLEKNYIYYIYDLLETIINQVKK